MSDESKKLSIKRKLTLKPKTETSIEEKPRAKLSIKRTASSDQAPKPKSTLSINRTSSSEEGERPTKRRALKGKRVIRRSEVDQSKLSRLGDPNKPPSPDKPKPKRPKKKRNIQPKVKKTPPSDIRMDNLNASLNAFEVWRDKLPLAIGIEKQIFQHIAKHSLSASKRVVVKLLKQHTKLEQYLLNVHDGEMRFNLDKSEAGRVTQVEREYAIKKIATS